MTRRDGLRFPGGVLAGLFLLAAPAVAQRVFVSARNGSDLNPCTVASPCRTFGQAIATVAAGGEVIALDSGGYGPFTVTKAVAISVPEGIYAGISVASGNGITISAGSSDQVVLRGLTINGAGGSNLIFTSSVGLLSVERCVLSGASAAGVEFDSPGTLLISDSVVRNSTSGVSIEGSLLARVVVDRSRLEHNLVGFGPIEVLAASVRDTVLAGNSYGVSSAAANPAASLDIDRCLIVNNGSGVWANNAGTVRVGNSTISGNGTAFSTMNGAAIESYGNNRMRGNSTLGSFTTVSLN